MPRLKLKDGYTLPFSTEPVEGVVVSGSYRPALPDTLGNYFFNRTTGKTMALFRCTQMVLYPR